MNSFKKIKIPLGILLAFLTTVAMIPIMPFAATIPFQDVQATDWFYASVSYMNDHGFMKGTSDTAFEPQTKVSRAMTVTILHRMEGQPATATSAFKDIPDNAWFSDSVAWAAAEGIVNGYSRDLFAPSDDVTREQIAAILYRYAGKKGLDVSRQAVLDNYTDSAEISEWATESMSWANAAGLITGLDEKTLAPQANATRAQIATILMRFCEMTEAQKDDPSHHPDNDPGQTDATVCTVTFDYNYDNKGVYKTIEVPAGQKADAVGQPERNNYRFTGWFTEEGNEFQPENTAISSDLTVYAHWVKITTDDSGNLPSETKYTVTFETNGGNEIPPQTLKKGQAANQPEDPVKEGYQFEGWYSNTELTVPYDFEKAVSKNIVLYAKWTPMDEDRSFTDRLIQLMPKDENWTISPYSLEMCLAMVANGAKGKTRDELLEVLQISDLEKYNSDVKTLLNTYDGFNGVMSLETANSIWINQDRFQGKGAFQKSFSDTLRLNYLAEARDVQDSNSVEKINAWADQKTHGKINRILDEADRQFTVALANAVYFKAAWANKFSPEGTKPQTFYNYDHTETETPFMYQMNDFPYYEADGMQAVELPYQNYLVENDNWQSVQYFKDADFGMYLLLSEKDLDLKDVLDHAEFHTEKVRLTVPKFKMEYGDSLTDELRALGVLAVFNPNQADLSGTIDLSDFPDMLPLYLDEVLQKVYLAIDEEGTEAAAVTIGIEKSGASLNPPPIYDFTADHPFYFVIRDNTSGKILFAGKYNQVS